MTSYEIHTLASIFKNYIKNDGLAKVITELKWSSSLIAIHFLAHFQIQILAECPLLTS